MKINLSEFLGNSHSQCGEDFLIQKLFELCNINSGWLVDCGSWDGMYLSNIRYHWERNEDFKVLMMESNPERFSEIEKHYPVGRGVFALRREVVAFGNNSLNSIFDKSIPIKEGIALLSIDIDGTDLEIFCSLDTDKYRPAIVIIEFGLWPKEQELNRLFNEFDDRDYELVYVTGNFIFVDRKFGIKSYHNVHELMRLSGNPEYVHYFGGITTEKMNEMFQRIQRDSNEANYIYKELAGKQYIETRDES